MSSCALDPALVNELSHREELQVAHAPGRREQGHHSAVLTSKASSTYFLLELFWRSALSAASWDPFIHAEPHYFAYSLL